MQPKPAEAPTWFFKNRRTLFTIAVISKIFVSVFTLLQPAIASWQQGLAVCPPDTWWYIEPIKNLLSNGTYTPDYRMPGYGVFYLPLTLLFGNSIALNSMVLMQILIDALAACAFISLAWQLTKSKAATIAALLFYGIGCTITIYNKFILSETVTASLLVFSFYYLVHFFNTDRAWQLAAASGFMVWAYFCRPVVFPLFLFMLCFVAIKLTNSKKISTLVWFMIPFVVIQSAWTARNYFVKQKLFLLTESPYYPSYLPAEIAAWNFSKTFADIKHYTFFTGDDDKRPFKNSPQHLQLPSEIYTSTFTADSAQQLALMANYLLSDTLSPDEKISYNQQFIQTINRYTASIKSEHFFLVYIKAPCKRLIKHITAASGVQFLFLKSFAELGLQQKLFKLFFIAIFLLSLYGSLAFVIIVLVKKKQLLYYFLAVSLLYSITVHPFVIGTSDVRYLYSFYPCIALCSVLFYHSVLYRIKLRLRYKK